MSVLNGDVDHHDIKTSFLTRKERDGFAIRRPRWTAGQLQLGELHFLAILDATRVDVRSRAISSGVCQPFSTGRPCWIVCAVLILSKRLRRLTRFPYVDLSRQWLTRWGSNEAADCQSLSIRSPGHTIHHFECATELKLSTGFALGIHRPGK